VQSPDFLMKASLNGPNRRKNRTGDKYIVADYDASSRKIGKEEAGATPGMNISFKVRSLETYVSNNDNDALAGSIGDACLFTVKRESDNDSGFRLLKIHCQQSGKCVHIHCTCTCIEIDVNRNGMRCLTSVLAFIMPTYAHIHSAQSASSFEVNSNDPLLIHFHNLPVFVLKAMPLYLDETDGQPDEHQQENEGTIYLSQAHCHNNKVCEDATYNITCCSRPEIKPTRTSTSPSCVNYDKLSAVQIEVFLRYPGKNTDEYQEFQANTIARMLMNHTIFSILTVNECLTLTIDGTGLVCRVSRVCVVSDKDDAILGGAGGEGNANDGDISSAEASLDEPYRGRMTINTEFYVEASNPDTVQILGARHLPEGTLPEDVIHITTSDDEWFPVRRILLASCLNLTKYVQAGRGKYKDTPTAYLRKSERSPDAPDGGIHCKVEIDCCTFDRVLLFIMSQLFPDDYKFALELSETNSLSNAAEVLGLLALSDLCASQLSSFASRVRKDKYIRFNEVKKRNEGNELLIIVDGMVLDISRWIDEHPGKLLHSLLSQMLMLILYPHHVSCCTFFSRRAVHHTNTSVEYRLHLFFRNVSCV